MVTNVYDQERFEAVFHVLIELGEEHGERLQLVVATNEVPTFAVEFTALQNRFRSQRKDCSVPKPCFAYPPSCIPR